MFSKLLFFTLLITQPLLASTEANNSQINLHEIQIDILNLRSRLVQEIEARKRVWEKTAQLVSPKKKLGAELGP